ncbi:NnrS protein [Pseudovibrio axinellae]|uniref:NnrS protein n=1 Tax=Pseudovibrio axinellae TaxID=989403 RepID=A0A165T1F4_9HYPH|nr:NnrS family protein [Pseudovibrio axinellae]KZL05165.1 NnrS protein [Pseudovibrio axinellae]SER50725.1 uncharacterized protein involved in response to NO [Pseudovibrio axinellae]
MSSTMEQVRLWQGPAIFSYGFRPFFLGAAVWACLSMLLWIPMITGVVELPTAFDPVSWHAHEFLFGYLNAVLGGFLLTAIPNWTGRMPIVGKPLALLFSLWVLGRFAILFSAFLPAGVVALMDIAMPIALALAAVREIIAGKNWRNLIVIALLGVLITANLMFHWEAWRSEYAAQGYGMRLGVSVMLLMVALIGGRVIPSFTRNWLAKQGAQKMPVSPMQVLDKVALLALMIAGVTWTVLQDHWVAGLAFFVAGVLHAVRLTRWCGLQTFAEPLLLVLHIGYLFLPIGLLSLGVALLAPSLLDATVSQHVLMAGVMGMMTLAVMTRAILGHTGRELTASKGTSVLFIFFGLSILARFAVAFLPDFAARLYDVAGLLWILSFAAFIVIYGPLLLRSRD